MAPAKFDLYQTVTDHIISTIENLSDDDHLIMPWHRSGLSELPTNVESKNHYNGVNILSLWVSAIDRGFTSNIWGTYRQWKKAGAQVRKGEKSTLVIFHKEYLSVGDDGEEQTQKFARASWAFNVAQVDGFEIPVPEQVGNSIGQLHQPFRDLGIVITQPAVITIAALADTERPAGQRNADPIMGDRFYGHLFAQKWPHYFFPRTSFSRSFCMLISAYMRFNIPMICALLYRLFFIKKSPQ